MSYPSKTEFDNLRNSLPLTYQTRGNYAFRTDLASNINTALRNVNTALAAYAKKTDIPVVPANVATKTDLAGYALASDLSKYQPAGRYVSPSELEAYQAKGDYALAKDLVSYAKSSDLANFQPKGEYALAADLASYAKSSDLANFQPKGEYALAANLASYAKSSDLANFQPKGEYALAADLASYAKESSLASYQPKGDYAVKSDLGNFQPKGDYALAKDLDSYAKQSSLAFYQPKGDYQTAGSYALQPTAGNYALQSELAGYQLKGNYQTAGNYALRTELANYALTKDFANLQPKGNYQTAGNYALQSELAGYQLKGNYQTAGNYALQPTAGNYALQSELAGYAKTAGASTFSGQATFDKNAIVKTEGTTPFQVLGTGGLRVSGGNLSVSGALATFENNATVTTSAGKPFEVKGAGGIDVDSIGIAAAGTITGKGRLHITGTELLYVLNKNGLMIGKEWGGNGNLDVQGDTTIRGNASIAGSLSGNSLFLESGLDPALRLGPAIKDIGNARLNVQDKTGSYMRFFSGATETGSITQDSGTSLNVNKVNAGQVSTGNAFITNATIGNFNMTGAPTFGALATFKKNATVETTTDKPFQVTGAGGLQVDHTKLKLGDATFVTGTDDWVRMMNNAGVYDYGLAGKNLYADGAVEISTGGNETQIKTPDGKTTINQSGIQFGGKNKTGYEENSAQISAGVHVPDSLNIVGMSDANKLNRKVDVWAEGGLTVYGEKLKVGGATFHSHPTDTWVRMSTDGGTTYNYGLAAKNFYASSDLSVDGNASIKGILEANSVGIKPTDSFIYGNNTLGHYGLKWADETGNKHGPTAFLSSYGGIKMFTQGGERVAIDADGNTTIKGGLAATTGSISNLSSGNASITNLTVGNFNMTGAPTFSALATFKKNATVETIADKPFQVIGPGGLLVTGGNFTVTGNSTFGGNSIFTSSGNVGIGTTSPSSSYNLDVSGNGRFTGNLDVTTAGNLSAANASITNLTVGKQYANEIETNNWNIKSDGSTLVFKNRTNPITQIWLAGRGENEVVQAKLNNDGILYNAGVDTTGVYKGANSITTGNLKVNVQVSAANADITNLTIGNFNMTGAPTFSALATFKSNAIVETIADKPFQVTGPGGLRVTGGNFTVTGDSAFSGNSTFNGVSTFSGVSTFANDLKVTTGGNLSAANANITTLTVGNMQVTGAPTFGALATFEKNATVTTSAGNPFKVTGDGGLKVEGGGGVINGSVTITGFGSGTNGSVLISGNDDFGHGLYVASSSAAGKRLGLGNTGTVGNVFAYDYANNKSLNLTLQGPGGNVGIGTDSPSAKLHVNGDATVEGASTFKALATFEKNATVTTTDSNPFKVTGPGGLLVTNDLSVNGNASIKGILEANSVGINPSDSFTYGNNTLGHYGLKWANETGNKDGPTAFLSSYGGIKMFTQGGERVAIGGNGTTFKTLATFEKNATVTTTADNPFQVKGDGGLKIASGGLVVEAGGAALSGALAANHMFLESGGDPALRLGPAIKVIGNARLNVQDKAGNYMKFFRGGDEMGSITHTTENGTEVNVGKVNVNSARFNGTGSTTFFPGHTLAMDSAGIEGGSFIVKSSATKGNTKVGINNENPTSSLDVVGNTLINGSLDLNFKAISGGLNLTNGTIGNGGVYVANNNGHYAYSAAAGDMIIRNNKGTLRIGHGDSSSAITIGSDNIARFPNGIYIGSWQIVEEANGNLVFYKNGQGGWLQDKTGFQRRLNF